MPFSPINLTVNSTDFAYIQSGFGRYMRDSVTFGSPRDFLRISAGSKNKGSDSVTAAITRFVEKDISTPSGAEERKALSTQFIIQTTPHFTVDEIDESVSIIDAFLSPATLNRILSGES